MIADGNVQMTSRLPRRRGGAGKLPPNWRRIKEAYLLNEESLRALGRRFGVSDTAIRLHAKANAWPIRPQAAKLESPRSFIGFGAPPLPLERITPPPTVGVYLLFLGDRLQYVGASTNVMGRIGQHIKEGVIPFGAYAVVPCTPGALAATEERYIQHYRPPHNKVQFSAYRLSGAGVGNGKA